MFASLSWITELLLDLEPFLISELLLDLAMSWITELLLDLALSLIADSLLLDLVLFELSPQEILRSFRPSESTLGDALKLILLLHLRT